MVKQLSCPICGSTNIKKSGVYRHKGKELQRYICLEGHVHAYFNEENAKDTELIAENVRYKKQTQKFQDTNRIERKAFRENARIENAVEEYAKELVMQKNYLNLKYLR